MTCIVGVELTGGKVVLAGDHLGSNGHTKDLVTQSKVFEHSGMLFGYTSSFRFGQVLEVMLDDNQLYPPSDPKLAYKWLISNFVPKLKDILSKESAPSGNCLIGINGQVWKMQDDYSVLRSPHGVNGVGSGEDFAISSIVTQLELNCSNTEEHITDVLDTAFYVTSRYVVSVSGEYSFIVK